MVKSNLLYLVEIVDCSNVYEFEADFVSKILNEKGNDLGFSHVFFQPKRYDSFHSIIHCVWV